MLLNDDFCFSTQQNFHKILVFNAYLFVAMQVVVEIPYVLAQGLVFTVIVYSMMSFQWTAAKFAWFFFISFFSFLYFTYYGMMTVSVSPNHQIAAIIASFFYALFNLFSGFFIPKPVSSSFTVIRCYLDLTVINKLMTKNN